MTAPFIINHLWQSSCFALLAGLLAFALRKNSPSIRYWVWLSASLKFLIPFALLVSVGSVVPQPVRHAVSAPSPAFPNTLVQIVEPFLPTPNAAVPKPTSLRWLPVAIGVVWALGLLAITLARSRGWLGVRAALRAGTPIELPIPVPAVITPGAEDPGIVGFLRPALVLPPQLLEHLNPQQLSAILTHEMCHVRRRDNFFAAVHMAVEAIFWFHPLVWWIGSRIVEERELACDQEVLRMGCEPADYVGGILTVCRLYVESPLPCISRVTGANVKKRLRAILAGNIAEELSGGKRATLAAIGLAALGTPVLVGVLNTPVIRAQTAAFEVVSIKPAPNDKKELQRHLGTRIDSAMADFGGVSIMMLITRAYGLNSFQVFGAPELNTTRFNILAKLPAGSSTAQVPEMLKTLLRERFRLETHQDTRDFRVYSLTAVKGGPKIPLKPADYDTAYARSLEEKIRDGTAHGSLPVTMARLADFINQYRDYLRLDRPVVDQSGLKSEYLIDLAAFMQPSLDAAMAAHKDGADPTAVESAVVGGVEKLGLRLEPRKVSMTALVIDHIEMTPTPQ